MLHHLHGDRRQVEHLPHLHPDLDAADECFPASAANTGLMADHDIRVGHLL